MSMGIVQTRPTALRSEKSDVHHHGEETDIIVLFDDEILKERTTKVLRKSGSFFT